MKKYLLLILLFVSILHAQIIRGVVKDKELGEGVYGANILEKGTTNGVASDFDGKFTLKVSKFPTTLVITSIGFNKKEIEVINGKDIIQIEMEASSTQVDEVVISESRITEKQKEAPLTVESMDATAIKQNSSVSFYEGLGNLKGVDLTSASIGFKVINTRGFNSTSPVRSLQLIDGVDNASPGLNFSLGNFLGSSELDILKVDLIQGASGSFFGPNAFNGVVSMTTKSPFDFTGVSASVKYGERNLFEGAFRYAQKFKDKLGKDRFAYKVNFYYLRANDWEATNYNPSTESLVDQNNPGGYDAVNRYGDEDLGRGNDFYTDSSSRKTTPGLGIFYRNGYNEVDLVDYNTQNIKGNISLHYKTRKGVESILSSSVGYGTTVYQGENRYSLRDILFFQNRLEVRQKDKFFVRFYATNEDAGRSFDAVVTAFLMQNNNKPLGPTANQFVNTWNQDYATYWTNNIANLGTGQLYNTSLSLYGVPFPIQTFGVPYNFGLADSLLGLMGDSLAIWHQRARDYANNKLVSGQSPYFQPGTAQFDSAFNAITSRPLGQGGSLLIDRSALYHLHGEYKWRFKPADETTAKKGWQRFTQSLSTIDFTVGGNARLYTPDSRGTIFIDTGNVKIFNMEFGAYFGLEKRWEKVKLNATLRMDKNINFPFLFSPAVSLVFTPHKDHTIRFSLASAIRNPTLADQYLNYNVGRAVLLGNLSGYDSLVTIESFNDAYSNAINLSKLNYFDVDPVKPEQVRSVELGYRGLFWNRWYVDASYYISFYQDFIGYKLGIELNIDPFTNLPTQGTRALRVATNSKDLVLTQGFSIQSSVYFAKYFSVSGNYTWNVLDRLGSTDPLIPAFNTPQHKFNVGIDGRDIKLKIGKLRLNNWGFGVNFKWIDGFKFEGSPQFTGEVPSYYMLDAQINYTWKKAHLTFKVGAQNITNNVAVQVYGGPAIGRIVFGSILLDWDFFKK